MVNPMGQSRQDIQAGWHTSPKWVIIVLMILSTILIIVGDIRFDASERLKVLNFALLIYMLSGAAWLLEDWQPRLGRWFTIISLVTLLGLGLGWLGVPGFLIFMTIPPALAVALLGFRAAVVTAFGETGLLLSQIATLESDPATRLITLVAIWGILGVMLMTYRPLYEVARWSWRHFQQAQNLLEEARDRKIELERALDALAQANRELALVNEKLAATRLIAEEAQKAKAAFVAKVSHEFRTPLNMIIGLIDSLTETPEIYEQEIPPVLLKDLEIVYRNSNHLASMINDVLDLSQAETGRLNLHQEWASLAADIDSVLTVVRPLLEKKQLDLTVSIPAGLPQVYYDRTRIRQVILNLVSNAARYTDTGGITLQAGQEGRYVVVRIADTGPGIAPAEAERVFEPFYQTMSGAWRGQGGSGLGLSISKQLIELHEGQIWLESTLGQGSTFAFKLPISPSAPLVAGPEGLVSEDWVWHERTSWPNLPQLPYQQRMIVCDETGALQSMINHYGNEIEFVGTKNLSQAIQELQRCPAHALIFNLALSHNFETLLAQARQAAPDTPIIGCSLPPPIEYALEAGAIDYLIKPIRPADLKRVLQSVNRPVRRVLVVDDNPDIQQLFARMLRICDDTLEVTTASGGRQCLDEMYHQRPDLVLLDVIMPDLDGWAVLEHKERAGSIKDIPVIMVSGEDLLRQPLKSDYLFVAMGEGISVNKLLQCSLQLSELLLKPG